MISTLYKRFNMWMTWKRAVILDIIGTVFIGYSTWDASFKTRLVWGILVATAWTITAIAYVYERREDE